MGDAYSMAKTSRTVNPLHFEDLEPHRFEDLVRQLAYDFKDWKSIEATGRSGSDEGFDVRAWENVFTEERAEDDDETEGGVSRPEGRLWLIQCKREKAIGPKKLGKYAAKIGPDHGERVYGVIFATACDFSKRARDTFRDVLREMGVQEFYLWGKAELEDMLFQPKNDNLLFGYFGISLTVRRRSLKTQIRSRLAIKRKALKYLGAMHGRSYTEVLIRDSKDTAYPFKGEVTDFEKNPPWRAFEIAGHYHSGIKVLVKKYFAYIADDGIHWDYVPKVNAATRKGHPWENEATRDKQQKSYDLVWRFWFEIMEENRAWGEILRFIPYDRIIAIDEDGDPGFQHPHIYIERRPSGDFFEDEHEAVLRATGAFERKIYFPQSQNQVKLFPKRFTSRSRPPKSCRRADLEEAKEKTQG